jgi:hypothetical protein
VANANPAATPPQPPTCSPLSSIFWDAIIAIATALMIAEIIASLLWAFS